MAAAARGSSVSIFQQFQRTTDELGDGEREVDNDADGLGEGDRDGDTLLVAAMD